MARNALPRGMEASSIEWFAHHLPVPFNDSSTQCCSVHMCRSTCSMFTWRLLGASVRTRFQSPRDKQFPAPGLLKT